MPTMSAARDVRPTHSEGEGPRQECAGDHGGDTGPFGVGHFAGQVRREDPGRADEAEQSDHRVRVVVRAPGQQERKARPKDAEPREGARAVPGAPAQDRFGRQKPQGGADQLAVTAVRAGSFGGQ